MKVTDVNIDDDYITVNGNDSIFDVAKMLSSEEIPDAVVVDDDGKVLGALDDFDIVSKVLAEDKDPKTVTAKDIMFKFPNIKLDTGLEEAEEIMNEHEATILPVVDDENNLLGVLTIMDVLEGLAKVHTPKEGIFSFLRGLF